MPCLRADVAVLFQIPAGLAHKPDRAHVGRPAPAGVQKTAGHWSHAHVCVRRVLAEEHAKPGGLCLAAQSRPLMKRWLGPGLAVERARCDHGNRKHALRRVAGSRVHDVAVDACPRRGRTSRNCRRWTSIRPSGSLPPRSCSRLWDRGSGLPARLARRRAQAVNAAPRRRDQRRANAVLLQDLDHAIDRVTLSDPARVEFDARPAQTRTVRLAGIQQDVAVTDLLQRPRISARCGRWPVPL